MEKDALTNKKLESYISNFSILPCSFFNSLSSKKCFALFVVNFLFKFFNLSFKSAFFAKSEISSLVANFACFQATKFGVTIRLLPPLFSYLLYKVNDPSLT